MVIAVSDLGMPKTARRATARPPGAQVDFQRLLGPTAWAALPAAVQARFGLHADSYRCCYDGQMVVRASPAGWLLAQLCRLIGTPLAPWTGEAVPTGVDVWLDEEGALVWDRLYRFIGHPPVLVSSRKTASEGGGLLEVVRGGFGMALDVSVEDGALHFRSSRYFVSLGRRRLTIPALITPGQAHVIHRDEGGGRFRFTLSFHHPLLRRTFYQDGMFADPPEG